MRPVTVTPRHCLVSWLLLLLLMLGVVSAVLLPWWGRMEILDREIGRDMEILQKQRVLLADRPLLEARMEDPLSQTRLTSDYLKGVTGPLAAAELQEQIKQIVGSAQGQLISTQTLPVEPGTPATKITVRVRMRTDSDAMLQVFHRLESGRPLLFVENLTIRQYQRRRSQVSGQLDVSFDLSGYMRQEGE